MNRRVFIQKASAVSLLPFAPSAFESTASASKEEIPQWILKLAPANDISVEQLGKYQVREVGPNLGGVTDHQLIFNPHSTAAFVRVGANALYLPNSKYYQSTELAGYMEQAISYLLKLQHSDGTIDLLSTNFHSTPDTAFLVKRLVNAYQLIEKSGTKQVSSLLEKVKSFLLKAGEALSVGGVHTPNHRWVVCGAMSALHHLWPNSAYINRINQWLAEGIDIDSDGQYNERSTYIYSSLSDRVLISVAQYADKPYLLDYVRKNLDMTRYYIHPNAEIVTDASGRQDKAIVGNLENYHYPYMYLAIKDQNKDYAGMCEFIRETAGEKIIYHLDYYLAEPVFWKELPKGTPPPVQYVKQFPHSGLVRIREGNWDSSIVAKNPAWLTFMKGSAVIQGVRLASSFFGKGQFVSEKIEPVTDGWRLTQQLEGPYYQPLPLNLLPGDGDWEKMPRAERPKSEIQKLETTVVVRKTATGIELDINSNGTDRVPLAVEIVFRGDGELKGVEAVPDVANSWLLKEGNGTYSKDGNTITFGPGIGLHLNTALRGSLPNMGAPTVYLTGFTPFKHVLKLS